jgi:hypothetical protein
VTTCFDVFAECVRAINDGDLIQAVSISDKEYHFQNWVQNRLKALSLDFDEPGRNTYPDFRLVKYPEGYEVKGLATPGRTANYDSNSQVPAGVHNGRTIFYVFGRYPKNIADFGKNEDGLREYPVYDLAICHGDFLNVHHEYIHKNRSIKGFGTYGDIMIRDRKMYVVPTPFAVTLGTTGVYTLILPYDYDADSRFEVVGDLCRRENGTLVVGYNFDLTTNELKASIVPNPNRGVEHKFKAYRLKGQGGKAVSIVEGV